MVGLCEEKIVPAKLRHFPAGNARIRFLKVREWIKEIPQGDSITLRCECALSNKQFKVWKRWFQRHENKQWTISDEHKSFFFYRSE